MKLLISHPARLLFLLCILVISPFYATAIEKPGELIDNQIGIFTKLGTQLDLKAEFKNQDGRVVRLEEAILPNKPVIIVPVYYKSPRLCGLVLNGLVETLNGVSLKLGRDYSIAAISFDPRETPELARESADKFFTRLSDHGQEARVGWNFLVGNQQNVSATMDLLGFKYLPDGDDFAHSSAIMILTPTGKISQYFTGIEFSPWDVRLALIDSSTGAIGSTIDHLLLYCFRFDPTQGKYTWAVMKVLRIGGVLTLLGMASLYVLIVRRGGTSS